jgi:hypothetical protein
MAEEAMRLDRIQFNWRVPDEGFRWLEGRKTDFTRIEEPRTFLTDTRPDAGAGLNVSLYRPLDVYSGLFRVLADTEPTFDGVQTFADRFGSLGGELSSRIEIQPDAQRPAYLAWGEELQDWRREIGNMRAAIRLWEHARHGDTDELARMGLRWRGETGVEIAPDPDIPIRDLTEPVVLNSWIASDHLGDDVRRLFVPGDLVGPALHLMQRLVNENMRKRASPRLIRNETRSQFSIWLVPEGLIGAVWVQFARAVERNNEFRRCSECGIWFELSPQTARSHKQFCSNACRTKAYRKRQAEAARLHGEGLALEDIARELESDPDTVRGWIERKRGSGGSPQPETE